MNILGLSTFAVEEVKGGGQHVVYNLYRELSRFYKVTLLSVVEYGKCSKEVLINENFRNVIIPQSQEQAQEMALIEQKIKIPAFDIIHITHLHLNKHFIEEAKKLVRSTNVLIFEHPYLIGVLDFIDLDSLSQQIIYHAIDNEFLQKKDRVAPELLAYVRETEERACKEANMVFAVSEYEAGTVGDMYDVPSGKLKIIPHGIPLDDIPFLGEAKNKPEDTPEVLFVGSWHPPNLEALLFIIEELAPPAPEINYTIIGSVKDFFLQRFPDRKPPQNVKLLGVLSDKEKWEVYKRCNIAVNPMFSGAGMNVKVLEYMAAGLPFVSTPFGVRGIAVSPETPLCEGKDFLSCIKNLLESKKMRDVIIRENRRIVEERYSWDKIADTVRKNIQFVHDYKNAGANLIDSVSFELAKMGIEGDNILIDKVSSELQNFIPG